MTPCSSGLRYRGEDAFFADPNEEVSSVQGSVVAEQRPRLAGTGVFLTATLGGAATISGGQRHRVAILTTTTSRSGGDNFQLTGGSEPVTAFA